MNSAAFEPACIVTPEFPGPMLSGGLGTAVYWQARTLQEAGIPVTVLCTGDVSIGTLAEWRERFQKELGIEFIEAGTWMAANSPALFARRVFPNHTNLVRALWVLEFLQRRPFGVVYLQDYVGHGLRALQAKQAGLLPASMQLVVTLHGPMEWALDGLEIFATASEQHVIEFQERESLRLADRAVAPSRHMRAWVVERWSASAKKIGVLPYCFEDAPPGRVVQKHGPFSHLVFFGRLETRKGLEIFLEAIVSSPLVAQHVRKVTFLGKNGQAAGTTGRLWIEKAFEHGTPFSWEILDDRDTFQAWSWLASQRRVLVIAPSLADNLPYSVIELFQRRLPFITTRVGGIPEIVGDNVEVLSAPSAAGLRQRLEETLRRGGLEIRYDTGFDPATARRATVDLHHAVARKARSTTKKSGANQRASLRKRPEVSVIIPHFNSAGYLGIVLETLARQQCAFPYEVLVVDDASTRAIDRTGFAKLARKYASDSRFRFFAEKSNRGAGGTRNFGVSHARGRYFVFFDADNEALPDLLAVYHRAIEKSGCDVMTCFLEQVTQDDYEDPRVLAPGRVDLLFMPPGAALEAGCFMNVFGDTCSIVRREAFERVGGFSADSPLYARIPSGDWDWDFFAKLALSGHELGVVPRVLFRYRNSSGNQQNTNRRRYYRNRSIILSRYASNEARKRVDWLRILALFEGGGGLGDAASPRGLYDYLASLPDALLAAAIGRRRGSPNDHVIQIMRARMKPLLAEWEESPPRLILYGAGLHTRVLLGAVPDLARYVVGVIDRTAGGAPFLGWPCIKPDQFQASECDVVIYSSKEHERTMHAGFKHHPVQHVLIYN